MIKIKLYCKININIEKQYREQVKGEAKYDQR